MVDLAPGGGGGGEKGESLVWTGGWRGPGVFPTWDLC